MRPAHSRRRQSVRQASGRNVARHHGRKLLAEARERLLARIIEIDAVRQRVARATAVTNAAYDRQRQLEDALCLQQTQFEELERSQSKLAEATKVLLQRFRDRERAVVVAEKKI